MFDRRLAAVEVLRLAVRQFDENDLSMSGVTFREAIRRLPAADAASLRTLRANGDKE